MLLSENAGQLRGIEMTEKTTLEKLKESMAEMDSWGDVLTDTWYETWRIHAKREYAKQRKVFIDDK